MIGLNALTDDWEQAADTLRAWALDGGSWTIHSGTTVLGGLQHRPATHDGGKRFAEPAGPRSAGVGRATITR